MRSFVVNMLPGRVVFGAGAAARLREEVERLGASRPLVVSSAGRRDLADRVAATVGAAAIWAEAVPHVPIEAAERAGEAARKARADCVIALGGGSAVGFGKALGLHLDLDQIALPTTYSGSEMTPILGITRDGVKRTVRDNKCLPETVVYDPELSVSLSPAASAASGMNALAHCVEALYARDANPVTDLLAREGARVLGRALPRAVAAPHDLDARGEALYGAYLAGWVLALGVALHHRICHVLGGSFGIGHGEANSVILPHVTRFNGAAAGDAVKRIAAALGTDDAAAGLFDLAQRMGAPTSLRTLGMKVEDLDRVAELTLETTDYNPRPIDFAGVRALLDDAWHGRRP